MQLPTCIFQDCIKWVQTSSQPFVLCLDKPKGSCYADFHPWGHLFPKNATSLWTRVSFLNSLCALEILFWAAPSLPAQGRLCWDVFYSLLWGQQCWVTQRRAEVKSSSGEINIWIWIFVCSQLPCSCPARGRNEMVFKGSSTQTMLGFSDLVWFKPWFLASELPPWFSAQGIWLSEQTALGSEILLFSFSQNPYLILHI